MMALLGNYSVFNKTPGRAFSGTSVSETRAAWGARGASRGRFTGWGGYSAKAGTPNGYLPPYGWVLPVKAGGLSSYTIIVGDGETGALNLAGGKNAVSALTGAGDLTGTGALIVSAVAAITGSGALSGAAVAYLNAVAALAGVGDVTGAIQALGNGVAALDGVASAAPVIRATGTVAADITPFTDLSPQSLASAVWSTAQGQFLYAVAHNRVVTDPVAGTFTVYDDDDTTVLYVADLWEDAAGTTPYQGSGADRRDRIT